MFCSTEIIFSKHRLFLIELASSQSTPSPVQGSSLYRVLDTTPSILARDGDRGINATLRYFLVPGPHSDAFAVSAVMGFLCSLL